MSLSSPIAGPELLDIIQSTQNADSLLQKLQNFLNSLPCPCADMEGIFGSVDSVSSPAQREIVQLFKLELLLYFSGGPVDTVQVDRIVKEHAYLSHTNALNPGSSSLLTQIKFNDLHMDYQFLLSPKVTQQDQGVKFVDLITKKINLLAMVPEASVLEQGHVTTHIQRKVLVYYLLCDSDFRKRSVLKYLVDENVIDHSLPQQISAIVSRKDRLIDMGLYTSMLTHMAQDFYPLQVIRKYHESQLIENHLDNNLSKLPRYYASLTLPRIRELLDPDSNTDLEELVFRMITCNKFPHGARIDQIAGVVSFGERPSKHSAFDEHVKRVCDSVDAISASLASGSSTQPSSH